MVDGFDSAETEDALPEFTISEILEMNKLFKNRGKDLLNQEFYQDLATKFSSSSHRSGKTSIEWEQVQSWFQDKQQTLAAKVSQSVVCERAASSITSLVAFKKTAAALRAMEQISISQKPREERIAELSDLMYEARSPRDFAWYDVASFLNYRVTCSGELEVRVRYAGFNNREDEWVNVKRNVRERSIPLEHSECDKVKVGDRVLCFRKGEDYEMYHDARIVEISRTVHDDKCCKCLFVVHHDHDLFKDTVGIESICRRPS